jgi:hypothetical protein
LLLFSTCGAENLKIGFDESQPTADFYQKQFFTMRIAERRETKQIEFLQ